MTIVLTMSKITVLLLFSCYCLNSLSKVFPFDCYRITREFNSRDQPVYKAIDKVSCLRKQGMAADGIQTHARPAIFRLLMANFIGTGPT